MTRKLAKDLIEKYWDGHSSQFAAEFDDVINRRTQEKQIKRQLDNKLKRLTDDEVAMLANNGKRSPLIDKLFAHIRERTCKPSDSDNANSLVRSALERAKDAWEELTPEERQDFKKWTKSRQVHTTLARGA